MKRNRRKFSAAFKAQVAIEALKERQTLADRRPGELSKRFDDRKTPALLYRQFA